jgi:hypothetical protein
MSSLRPPEKSVGIILLIRRIQTEEMSKMGWLVGFVKHVIHIGRYAVFPVPIITFNFQTPNFILAYPMTLLVGMLG